MATKPAVITPKWATSTNYTVGPKTGQPTKADLSTLRLNGQVPGKGFPMGAQTMNFWQGSVADWIADWVALGAATGALDAHIVETTANGRTALAGVDLLGNAAYAGPTLSVISGASNQAAGRFTRAGVLVVNIGGPAGDEYGVHAQTTDAVAFKAAASNAAAIHLVPLAVDPSLTIEDVSVWAIKDTTATPDVACIRAYVREKRHIAHFQGHALHLAVSDESTNFITTNSEITIFDNVTWDLGSIPFTINALYPLTVTIVEYSFSVAVDPGSNLALTVRFYSGVNLEKTWVISVPAEFVTQQSLRFLYAPNDGPADYKITVQRTAGADYTIENNTFTIRTGH